MLLIAEDAPVHGARQRERLPRPGHPHVNETPFLLDSFFFGDGPAVRTDAFFHAREEHVVEFQTLGVVQGDESHAGLAFKLIRVTYERRGIEEIGEGLPGFHAFGDGTRKLFEVFQPCDIFRSVAVLKHGHIAGFLKYGMKESRGFLGGKGIL